MSAETPTIAAPVTPPAPVAPLPVTLEGLPAELQILTAEHSSLLTARSLVYNEAFTRASMFLDLLGMSFVGLALLATAVGFSQDFLIVAVIVLAFDFLVGVLTYVRVMSANGEDFSAMHAMNRIRHGYLLIAPNVRPFLTSSGHDDVDGVMQSYGYSTEEGGDLIQGLSTSGGMVGLIVTFVGGLLVAAAGLLVGLSAIGSLIAGVIGAAVVFAVAAKWALDLVANGRKTLETRFPTPPGGSSTQS
jgi:hypothetical protein